MTDNLDLIRKEPVRILEALVRTDPDTDEYGRLLDYLCRYTYAMPDFIALLSGKRETHPTETKVLDFPTADIPNEPVGHPDPVGAPGEPGVTGVPTETAETKPDEPTTLSRTEVRERLATMSNQHDNLDVAAIMAEMGYSKLSDVPVARYNELLERVEKAARGDS